MSNDLSRVFQDHANETAASEAKQFLKRVAPQTQAPQKDKAP